VGVFVENKRNCYFKITEGPAEQGLLQCPLKYQELGCRGIPDILVFCEKSKPRK